jgi:hypothetical protein
MTQTTIKDHRLTLPEVVDALVAEGMIEAAEATKFKQERRYFKGDTHPLSVIAGLHWKSLQPPHRMLDLEFLTQWLAKWCGLDYLHIDPLKINLAAVTGVMSNTYATRFRILPVEVRPNEVVIATAEPFQRDWEAEMRPILRKDIRRVISNPEDILRYQVEFYNLAKFIKGALDKGDVAGGASNFEQLVELGKSNKQFDANDQHIVRLVDWLWQYAFEQRASDIHIEPRRNLGIVRFRIDGVLHQVHQIPMAVLNAMTSRMKILGRMDVIEKRRPQDGRVKTRTQEGQEVELRLSTLPTAFGEKLVMRIFDPDVLVRDFSELGFAAEDIRAVERDVGPAQRHHPGDRADRLRQDRDPVLDAEEPRHAGRQRLHAGGPDRDGRGLLQPGADRPGHRHGFRRGHPLPDAAGPRHHHGRRDPRPGDGRHGHPGGADRPPRVVNPAYQRCAVGDHAAGRTRGAALHAVGHAAGRHGAAPDPHPVPEVQAARRTARRGRGGMDRAGGAVEVHHADPALPSGGLPRLPHDGLQGARRHLRDHAACRPKS